MKIIKIIFGLIILISAASCTKDFEEINTDPNGVLQTEASGKFFITNPQYVLYGPDRYPYWRAQLIHTDRYAGHFTFGHDGSWWGGDLGYSYNPGYTDASWDWLAGYLGQLDNFVRLTDTGGEFENEYMYATGLIMKGLYFQKVRAFESQALSSTRGQSSCCQPAPPYLAAPAASPRRCA